VAETEQETLARLFLQVARQLEAEDGRVATQERITSVALGTVPGCRHAAISLVRAQGPIRTVAATDELPERVDEVQYRIGQGPCLEAIEMQGPYRTGDLAAEERWPDFAKAAVEETGVRSMLSFRLFVREDTIGALNLYSREADAFDHRVLRGGRPPGRARRAGDGGGPGEGACARPGPGAGAAVTSGSRWAS